MYELVVQTSAFNNQALEEFVVVSPAQDYIIGMVGMSKKVRKANEKTSESTSAALRHTVTCKQSLFYLIHCLAGWDGS